MRRGVRHLAALLLLAAAARGDSQGSASAKVYVDVRPNIALAAMRANVDAGTVRLNGFHTTIRFRIDANLECLWLYVEATPLFKADDPRGTEVAPIPLDTS